MKKLLAVAFVMFGASSARAEPGWCKTQGLEKPDLVHLEWAIRHGSPVDDLPSVVGESCWPDPEGQQRSKEIDAARAYWTKRMDLTEGDWVDIAVWTANRSRNAPTLRLKDRKQAWSAQSPIGQFILIYEVEQFSGAYNYVTDALDAHLTELGRLSYILKCLSDTTEEVQWAMCQPDIDRLDRKKLGAELRADTTYGGFEKIAIRIWLDEADAKLKKRAETIKALVAKDAAHKKVFDVAAQARNDWAQIDPQLAEMVLAMDDAAVTGSRKATDGCSDKIWPMFKAAVAKIPAKSFADAKASPNDSMFTAALVRVVISEPEGYLAGLALLECERDELDPVVEQLDRVLNRWSGFRGPRSMAESRLMQAGIVFDDRDAKLVFPPAGHEVKTGLAKREKSEGRGYGRGVVSKVTSKGDTTHIEFKHQTTTQTHCTNYKESNKIRGVDSAGNLVYDGTCLAEKTETIDNTWPPLEALSRYAEGIKPGMVLEPDRDAVVWVFAKNGAKLPSLVFGAAVK